MPVALWNPSTPPRVRQQELMERLSPPGEPVGDRHTFSSNFLRNLYQRCELGQQEPYKKKVGYPGFLNTAVQIHTASSCSTQRSALKQVKEEAHLVCNWLLPMDAHSTKPQIAAPPTPPRSPGSGVGFPASWWGGAQAEVARESPHPARSLPTQSTALESAGHCLTLPQAQNGPVWPVGILLLGAGGLGPRPRLLGRSLVCFLPLLQREGSQDLSPTRVGVQGNLGFKGAAAWANRHA